MTHVSNLEKSRFFIKTDSILDQVVATFFIRKSTLFLSTFWSSKKNSKLLKIDTTFEECIKKQINFFEILSFSSLIRVLEICDTCLKTCFTVTEGTDIFQICGFLFRLWLHFGVSQNAFSIRKSTIKTVQKWSPKCVWTDGRTDERTDGRTDGRTNEGQAGPASPALAQDDSQPVDGLRPPTPIYVLFPSG